MLEVESQESGVGSCGFEAGSTKLKSEARSWKLEAGSWKQEWRIEKGVLHNENI
ncbi:MAG: hypothetical protein AAFP76_03835 [Bacteroidota bacterium]